MRDQLLSSLALALYSLNVQAVRLLCTFHEPKKTNFFELLDFATIGCFFECFASSDTTNTSDSFDSLDESDFPSSFWADSSDGSKYPDSSDHTDSSKYSRECTYLGRYRDAFSGLLKHGPTIEQNGLDHELVKALNIRNMSAASSLTHHGARLSVEAGNTRADLVLTNYCKCDWAGLLRELFNNASDSEGLARDIDWWFGEKSSLISKFFMAKDVDGFGNFWKIGARTLEVTLKIGEMDLELRKVWGCRSAKGKFWRPDLGVCNFWVYLMYREWPFPFAECTTTADSRKSQVKARWRSF
jgi:hypothetical protein